MTTPSDLPIPSEPPHLPENLTFLGPAPLIQGEEISGYDTLLARISGAVKPADILEEIWVRDVVDLVWDAIRLRRWKAALITASVDEGMQRVLLRFDVRDFIGVAKRWAARDEETVREIDALFTSAGLTMDAVMAQTLRLLVGEIERIDRMSMSAEVRRNAALREPERHRAGFAQTLRRVAQEVQTVEDAEFEVVAPAEQAA